MRNTWQNLGEVVTRVVDGQAVERRAAADRTNGGQRQPARPSRKALAAALAAFAPVRASHPIPSRESGMGQPNVFSGGHKALDSGVRPAALRETSR